MAEPYQQETAIAPKQPVNAKKAPTFDEWLTSPQALAMTASLLEASGPSPVPISIGQAIGRGINNMQNVGFKADDQRLKQGHLNLAEKQFGLEEKKSGPQLDLLKFQVDKMKEEFERRKALSQLFRDTLNGNTGQALPSGGSPSAGSASIPTPSNSNGTLLNPSGASPLPQAAVQSPTMGLLNNSDDPRQQALKNATIQSLLLEGKEKEAYELWNGGQNLGRPFAAKDMNGKDVMAVQDTKTGKVFPLPGIMPAEATSLFVQNPDGSIIAQGNPSGIQQLMSKPNSKTVGDLQEDIAKRTESLKTLDNMVKDFKGEYLTRWGQAKYGIQSEIDKLGENAKNIAAPLGLYDKDFVQGRIKFRNGINQFFNQYRKEITGQAAGMKELAMIKDSMFNEDQGPDAFQAAFQQFREKIDLGYRIKQDLLREGVPVGSKRFNDELESRMFSGSASESTSKSQPSNKKVSTGPASKMSDSELKQFLGIG
jgi:hypothetical protein